MATKNFCDRCGAEIKGASYFTTVSTYRYEGSLPVELCDSCACLLAGWLRGKEKMVGEVQNDG